MIKKILEKKGIDYRFNENYPEDVSTFNLKDVYYVPALRTFFDDRNRINYNDRKKLALLGYEVKRLRNSVSLIYFLEKNDISN